jgi:hypothetical protein
MDPNDSNLERNEDKSRQSKAVSFRKASVKESRRYF